ncbi:MAG: M20 family metallopeptidase, partial [Candidatus Saccharibacteria bacterium]
SSDKAANHRALDYIQTFLAERGMFIARHEFNGYGALVATTVEGSRTPKVMLAAHVDVVPGPDSIFALRHEDGKFLGRGVFDMQFAIASFMQVVATLGGRTRNYDFGIMITTDEEVGGLNGTAKLIEMGYKPSVCVLPDGARDWQIETFAKGFIYGKFEVQGKAAHGSTPWEGDSATFRLINLLHDFKHYFADQTLNTNTLNISIIEGGAAKNQIPAYASAHIDVRLLSMVDYAKINEVITMLCAKHGATYAEEPLGGHPCVNNLDHPLIQPFAESIKAVTGVITTGTISYGASDARFFATIDVPCIICRPAGGGQHADGEWIDAAGCVQYSDVLIDYLNKVAKQT